MALPNVPQSRNEKYLAKISGQEVELPNEPLSREEQYLDYIAKNGGGGGSYVLPTATESRLGGVKIGSGISVEEDGTISADIPTKVSELDNDEDFISDADYVHTDNNYDNTAKGIVNGVTEALAGKQDELTFDNIPTEDSINPVKSGGVYASDEAIRQWTTAEAKSVSGNPITLTDGSARNVEGLVVTCNPKQNLHGYEKPWAGGAGKNKLPNNLVDDTVDDITYTKQSDDGIKINGTSTGRAVCEIAKKPFPNGDYIISKGSSNGLFGITVEAYNDNTWVKVLAQSFSIDNVPFTVDNDGYNSIMVSIGTQSGRTANNIVFYPMIRLASVSDATFAPYSNECPITGLTECVVDRDGKNKLPMTVAGIKAANTAGTWNGNVYTLNNTTIEILSDETNVNVYGFKVNTGSGGASNYTAFCLSTTYTDANNYIINGITGGAFETYLLQVVPSGGGSSVAIGYNGDKSYTISEAGNYTVNIVIKSGYVCPSGGLMFYPMIRLASVSDATYVPYSHDTATITFGQTVYGGTVNFKTGKVSVTHGIVDLGTLAWSIQPTRVTGKNRFRTGAMISIIKPAPQNNVIANIISSDYKAITAENTYSLYDGDGIGVDTSGAILIYDSTRDTLTGEQFKTAMDGVQLCYELATPTELTLTPAELELLKGYNYITTNGTTIALAYLPNSLLAEAEAYVDAKIPPAPSSDGTYVLTCTVTDGTPAYSWESAT